MRLLVTYITQEEKVRLLAVYSEKFSLERKMDFKPVPRSAGLEEVEAHLNNSPLVFCNLFFTDVDTDLDEENFTRKFAQKLSLSISQFGDEKTLVALSMSEGRE